MLPVLRGFQIAAIAAVILMSAWNAHIVFRRRPDWPTMAINLAFWVVPVGILVALTGQPWKSYGLGTALVFVLQRIHWLKWRYLSDTWTAADFRMVFERANWLVVRLYPFIAAFVLAAIGGLIAAWVLLPAVTPFAAPARLGALAVAVVFIALVVRYRRHHVFDPFGFNTFGHFANLVFSLSSLEYQPPQLTADSDYFKERAALLDAPALSPSTGLPSTSLGPTAPHRSTAGAAVHTGRSRPDLVVWLQESATDPRVFTIPGAEMPHLAMHEPDARTRASGWLRVPTWGGRTWLSEFALLTGLRHEDFGPAGRGVFYTVTPHLRYSLPKLLRAQGYHTVVLFPIEKTFYNAEAAYGDLGFDEVLNPLDFPEWQGKSLSRHLVPDSDLCAYALKVLDRPRDKPIFLYMLSMIQHGPYDTNHALDYGLDQTALPRATAARLSDWIGRMRTLSDDTVAFEQALAARPGLVWTYFGDHQPNLEGDVPMVPDLDAPQFLTRFMIKSAEAPATPGRCTQTIDAAFLAALLLEHAGIPLDPYFAANVAMRRLCGGKLIDCEDQALRESYRTHVYRDLAAAARGRE